MRLFVLALTLALLAQPLSAAPDRSRKPVDIPAQTLSSALERLARERGLQIVYLSERTDALQTAGARGDLTPDEALARLLDGTGLSYKYLDDETVTIVTSPPTVVAKDAVTPGVTVEGRRPDLEQQVRSFVHDVSRSSGDQPLTRWRVPICPLVAGLPAKQGEFILARLSEIARSAGAPVGSRTCRPNFYVIAGNRAPGTAGAQEHNPVRVFYNARIETADGMPKDIMGSTRPGTGLDLSGPPTSDTRIEFPSVTRLASVLVLVDTARIKGVELGQLADYIAMVGFAVLDPAVDTGSTPTILRLFTSTAASPPPKGLSEWDESFLKALYSTRQSSRFQQSEISQRMLGELRR